eukprot:COSAG01_NODE_11015_length_2026_cov_8.214323_2_plen_88_part_00
MRTWTWHWPQNPVYDLQASSSDLARASSFCDFSAYTGPQCSSCNPSSLLASFVEMPDFYLVSSTALRDVTCWTLQKKKNSGDVGTCG